MDGCLNGWMDKWMGGVGGLMDGWIYLLTAVELTPVGSSTVHIYTQTIHRTTQLFWEVCGPCPVFASYTLAFALQLRRKHGKHQKARKNIKKHGRTSKSSVNPQKARKPLGH